MRLPPLSLTILDTETTGFVPRVHHIIEFASVRVENGTITDTYEQLLAVTEQIPPHVQVLTRIKPEALLGKATMDEKRAEIIEHIGTDTLLVGQNLGFDLGMLKGEGIDLSERAWIDTSMLASLVFPEFRSYSLQYMSSILQLRHEPAHRALGDVHATLELLGKIWERLLELPRAHREELQSTFAKTGSGYHQLFQSLSETDTATVPAWMIPRARAEQCATSSSLSLPKPAPGTVALVEEGLDPGTLQDVINAAAADASGVTWIAVKNLEGALRRLHIPANLSVIHPPDLLLNPEAVEPLWTQPHLTPAEAFLLLKVRWFAPRTRFDTALHGDEKDVWSGRLACTETSSAYTAQFAGGGSAFLLDHRQLLQFLQDPAHAAHTALQPAAHIIIHDASMLEDTATKAYGYYLSIDTLRAAAQQDPALVKLTDLLALWIEQVRGSEDQHLFTPADYRRSETESLRELVAAMRARTDLPEKTQEQLTALEGLLHPSLLPAFLVWSERRMDGGLTLTAAPERVDALLEQYLYSRYATTLLVPAGCTRTLRETVPASVTITEPAALSRTPCSLRVRFPEDPLASFFQNPPPGKTIVLLPSKRAIEQVYITYAEELEAKGVTLICQGLAGGQGRMESEFIAADAPALWVLTPFLYEGMELPQGTADRLIIDAVPFDFPGQPVFSRRKDHHKNGFQDYALQRLQCRLFRLLRTFCRQRSTDGECVVLDKRLREKDYGKHLTAYLSQFGGEGAPIVEKKTTTKKEEGQMRLF